LNIRKIAVNIKRQPGNIKESIIRLKRVIPGEERLLKEKVIVLNQR